MKYSISLFVLLSLSIFGVETVYLKTPNLSQENIMGTNVGIRPYRKTGVRIEAEVLNDKLIIHNYGYGGSGLTLSLGGAKEVLDILEEHKPESKIVAILGAGVAGMTTAYDLLELGYNVHIYSDEWSPDLTSNVAAGIWSPAVLADDVPICKKELNERILKTSEKRFLLSTGENPQFAGVRMIDSYSFKTESSLEAIKTKHKGEEVTVQFNNGVTKSGRVNQEIGIDGKLFMEDLYRKVKEKGAHLIQRHFESLEDILALNETIVINCTSMGSRMLFNDQEFLPVRGQIIYFNKEEEADSLFYQNVPSSSTTWVSIYPWSDRIILGGVYEPGEEDIVSNAVLIEKIIENGEKFLSNTL